MYFVFFNYTAAAGKDGFIILLHVLLVNKVLPAIIHHNVSIDYILDY